MDKKYWFSCGLLLSTLLMFLPKATAQSDSILFVSSSHSNKAKVTLLKEVTAGENLTIDQIAEKQIGNLSAAKRLFNRYRLVIFDGVSVRESTLTYEKYIPIVATSSAKFLAIRWLEQDRLRKGITSKQAALLNQYYVNGGRENLHRMSEYLIHQVLSSSSIAIKSPIIYPEMGIYHPDYSGLVFSSFTEYRQWRFAMSEDKPVIGILLQRALIEAGTTHVVDATIAKLEEKGMAVVPFFFKLSPITGDYTPLLMKDGYTLVDLIINFRSIHWANQRKREFEKLGVPVLQALTYYDGDQHHWEQSIQGISPGMTPFTLVLPEAAGVIDPVIVAAVNEETGRQEAIDYQLDFLVGKALKWVQLKTKPNKQKKLSVMVWGEKYIGASFLNVPKSLATMSSELSDQGYAVATMGADYLEDNVDRILYPFFRDYELEALLKDDLAELMPVAAYLTWFNKLPSAVTQPINEYWGEPKNSFMTVKRDGEYFFVIPRIRNGNLLIMRQPPRAGDKDEDKRIFHKGDIPMNHYYLAAYFYVREFWQSDAIIHLGTHGSQEYLSGKERGLSRYDQSNLAVGETPVFYPFIVDNVGEAMQTKRRGSATVLAHMTPPFAAAGLQGGLGDLHELLHQYKSLEQGGVKEKTKVQLMNDCIATEICTDMGLDRSKVESDFTGFLSSLEKYLHEVATQNQPLGLHTYGELPEERLIASTILQMLGPDFLEPVGKFEQHFYQRHSHAHTPHENHHHHHHHRDDHKSVIQEHGDDIEHLTGFKTVSDFIINKGEIGLVSEELQPFIEKGRRLYADYTGIQELNHLIKGLAGEYIPVKNGGDPIRNPNAVPTGFNLYGFDPARVPTKAAYEQGKELVEQVISDYYQQHGRYPDKLAFSLWSIETMRHYGVLESQALYAMGVRPVWTPDGRVKGVEVIPTAELKRPRVDVVLSVTGLYRDAFPNVIQRIAKALEQVAALAEDNNYVWQNSQRIEKSLQAEGLDSEEAKYLSMVRIFSSASGEYGSGVDDAVVASDTWETDTEISDLYLAKMGYFYGSDNSRWSGRLDDVALYAKHLSGTDIALFSRSSNVYGLISSDDPFEYFGALALAVRNLDGKNPEMLISNLRDPNNAKAEQASRFLAKELRTRSLNRRWVSEMQKEGYSGAVTFSERVTNFWGWQVVDPSMVRDDQWQTFFDVYIEDVFELDMENWFNEVNPGAQAQIIEKMIEAVRKTYWQTDEATIRKLIERYVEIVEQYDWYIDNEQLREYVNTRAQGFGLNMLPVPVTDATANANPIEGQKLSKVDETAQTDEWNKELIMLLLLCAICIVAGALWQQYRPRATVVDLRRANVLSVKDEGIKKAA